MEFRTVTVLQALTVTLLFSFAACTQDPAPEFSKGQTPFAQELANLKNIAFLEIAKADPKTGDIWTAKFQRARSGSNWEILAGPGGGSLMDRQAQSSFIEHLLDTLKTLRVTGAAPHGPPETFGLVPPRFALRWGTSDLTKGEIRFGHDSYAGIGPAVYPVEGAALKMLEYIGSFQSLREQTLLSPLTSDEVDEIEVYHRSNKAFYAQREGSVWTDHRHRPVKKDVHALLEQITHWRIQEFVDAPENSARLLKALVSRPLYRVVLKDRHGHDTQLRIQWSVVEGTEGLYGEVSSRPGAVFRIFSEGIRFFELFRK